jgi:hypothetical protein
MLFVLRNKGEVSLVDTCCANIGFECTFAIYDGDYFEKRVTRPIHAKILGVVAFEDADAVFR